MRAIAAVTAFLLGGSPLAAGAAVVWDQSPIGFGRGVWQITNSVVANDFELTAPTDVSGFQVWISDENTRNDNGALDDFSGTLGYAIYEDDGGLPGTELTTGSATPTLVDTGQQQFTVFNSTADVFTAEVSIPTLTLGAGIYWLSIHDGDWLSANDGSETGWIVSGGFTSVLSPIAFDSDEEAPDDYLGTTSNEESAFLILGTAATGDVPAPTTWSLLLVGAGLLAMRRRRTA